MIENKTKYRLIPKNSYYYYIIRNRFLSENFADETAKLCQNKSIIIQNITSPPKEDHYTLRFMVLLIKMISWLKTHDGLYALFFVRVYS